MWTRNTKEQVPRWTGLGKDLSPTNAHQASLGRHATVAIKWGLTPVNCRIVKVRFFVTRPILIQSHGSTKNRISACVISFFILAFPYACHCEIKTKCVQKYVYDIDLRDWLGIAKRCPKESLFQDVWGNCCARESLFQDFLFLHNPYVRESLFWGFLVLGSSRFRESVF